jgi:hypothetical protein
LRLVLVEKSNSVAVVDRLISEFAPIETAVWPESNKVQPAAELLAW